MIQTFTGEKQVITVEDQKLNNMAYRMKGHTLPGIKQRKSPLAKKLDGTNLMEVGLAVGLPMMLAKAAGAKGKDKKAPPAAPPAAPPPPPPPPEEEKANKFKNKDGSWMTADQHKASFSPNKKSVAKSGASKGMGKKVAEGMEEANQRYKAGLGFVAALAALKYAGDKLPKSSPL